MRVAILLLCFNPTIGVTVRGQLLASPKSLFEGKALEGKALVLQQGQSCASVLTETLWTLSTAGSSDARPVAAVVEDPAVSSSRPGRTEGGSLINTR